MSMNYASFKPSLKDLRIPTVLEKAVDVNDGEGGINRQWVPQSGTVWVGDNVRHVTYVGEGQQLLVETLHWITLRYVPNVTGADKWRFNGKFGTWYVRSIVDPFNTFQWLVAVCTEVGS